LLGMYENLRSIQGLIAMCERGGASVCMNDAEVPIRPLTQSLLSTIVGMRLNDATREIWRRRGLGCRLWAAGSAHPAHGVRAGMARIDAGPDPMPGKVVIHTLI
jgi:hypothetical protein